MSAFNGNVATPLAVSDPGTDHKLPAAGSLSYGAITSQTALAGTNGVDTALVKGNEWQHFTGNYTEFIDQNYQLTVKGNRQEMLQSNQKLTVVGKTNETFVGVHNRTNIAPFNQNHVHTATYKHSQPSHVQQPTTYQRHENNVLEYFQEHFEHAWFKIGIVGLNIDTTAVMKLQWASVYLQDSLLRNKLTAFHELKCAPLSTRIVGLLGKINWTEVAVAMAYAHGVPLDVNAGVDVNELVIPPF
jgi:hypothetical protein